MRHYNEKEIICILKKYAPDFEIRMSGFKQDNNLEYQERISKLKNGVILIHFIEQLRILKKYMPEEYELCKRLGPSKHYPDSEMDIKTNQIIDNSAELRNIRAEVKDLLQKQGLMGGSQ